MATGPIGGELVTPRQEALTRTLDLLEELVGADRRDEVDATLAHARVRVSVTAEDLRLAATQAAVYALVMLTVRSGMAIEARLPAVPTVVELPGLTGGSFDGALAAAVPRMFPGASVLAPTDAADIVVAFGDAPKPPGNGFVHVGCRDRRAWTSARHCSPWQPAGPLPALAAAGLAAADVLKAALRRLDAPAAAEVLAPLDASFTVPFALACPIDLGEVFAVSAGAITQNFFLVLAADDRISGAATIFDRDRTELSNANRCPFVLVDEVPRPKVDAVRSMLPSRLAVHPVPSHLTAANRDLVPAGSVVVVGADDIGARHLAQQLDPCWLGIGATSHYMTLVTEHPRGAACAGCAHPTLGDEVARIPTLAIVSFWAGYLLALRLVARAAGAPYGLDRQETTFWPLRPGAGRDHRLAVSPRCPVGHSVAA